jgi:hypothetical protein
MLLLQELTEQKLSSIVIDTLWALQTDLALHLALYREWMSLHIF